MSESLYQFKRLMARKKCIQKAKALTKPRLFWSNFPKFYTRKHVGFSSQGYSHRDKLKFIEWVKLTKTNSSYEENYKSLIKEVKEVYINGKMSQGK